MPAVAPESPANPADTLLGAAWTAAVAELREAREAVGRLDPAANDLLLEAIARQDLFLARRKLRQAQEALTGETADLPWSAS
jgi:hypothetical protein